MGNREACYIVHTILASHGKTVHNCGIVHSMEGENGVDFILEVDNALKATLEDRSERALFISNLGKINTEALLNNPDMGRFPNLQGNTFNGPTMFITGEKKPSWECDKEVRAIRQLFPNSFFVKVSFKHSNSNFAQFWNNFPLQIPGAGHWVHTEKTDDFLAAAVTFLQTEF